MRKKVIIAALAVAMSVTCTNAATTTNVTGATQAGTNTYEVSPERVFGEGAKAIGYRKYDNFSVADGQVLNMIFNGPHKENVNVNGLNQVKDVDRPVGTFINLVGSKVQIDGVVNSVDAARNFYNGHAIFIAPGGFAVGQNGVVNVGQLHVATPTTAKYNELIEGYDASLNGTDKNLNGIRAINDISKIKQDSNANIDISGKVFAYDGIDLRGKTVTVNGNLVNGVKNQQVLDKSKATTLFNNLVGTDAKVKNAVNFQSGASMILIKSQKNGGGIVTGANSTITNGAGGGVYLTNDSGSAGITTQGKIYDPNFVRLYNQAGALYAKDGAIEAKRIEVSNAGTSETVAATLTGDEVQVANVGSGKLTTGATINAKDTLVIRNAKGSGMAVAGKFNGTGDNTTIAINNDVGNAVLSATITNTGKNATTAMLNRSNDGTFTVRPTATTNGNLKFSNEGAGGMIINGEMTNKGTTYIVNRNGKLTFEDTSKVTNDGKLYILGKDKSIGIYQGKGSVISNKNGDIVLKNASGSSDGLTVNGTIKNEYGTIAINNHAGYMDIGGTVDAANGNLGIINRTGSKGYSMTGEVTAKNANLKQNGDGDMNVGGQINHNGRVNVVANKGMLNLTGGVLNTSGILGEDGGFYAVSRMDGRGVDVAKSFTISGTGEVLIKNVSGPNGLNYEGTIQTNGHQATILNDKGNMNVDGKIETKDNKTMIRNRGGELNFGENTNVKSGQKGLINNKGNKGEAKINENAKFQNMDLVDKPQK